MFGLEGVLSASVGPLAGGAWLTIGAIGLMVTGLVREWARPDMVVLGTLALLLAAGVVAPERAFSGFANTGMLTVAALFVVAAGVQRTDALAVLDQLLFSGSRRLGPILSRLMLPVSVMSAVLNNTPIVAMLTPRLQQWAEQHEIPVSKLLIPLSYAAITGGMVTLMGTSTNLVVSGLMQAQGYEGLGLFDMAWIGIPAALAVMAYFILGGHRLLPARSQPEAGFQEGLSDCLFEVRVSDGSPLDGESIEDAGLRSLGNAYLVHLRRPDAVVPVTPQTTLQEGDVLTFAGSTLVLDELLQQTGLTRSVPLLDDLDGYAADSQQTLPVYEAVVAASSALVGKTLREANFREQFRGVVIAIQRKDEQLTSPLGRTPIQAGDLLLIEAPEGFDRRWNANRDEFYLVAPRSTAQPNRSSKAPVALLILVSMIALAATGAVPIVTAAFLAALGMMATRCLHGDEARDALDVQVLIVIAAALGIGEAVQATGLAEALAGGILSASAPFGYVAVLVALYVTTNLLTELITNNAAAALMLPVALAVGGDLGLEPKATAVLVAVAASASFVTPIGYQTNLMVMTPGGYRFGDYVRVGLPVSVIVMALAITALMLGWV